MLQYFIRTWIKKKRHGPMLASRRDSLVSCEAICVFFLCCYIHVSQMRQWSTTDQAAHYRCFHLFFPHIYCDLRERRIRSWLWMTAENNNSYPPVFIGWGPSIRYLSIHWGSLLVQTHSSHQWRQWLYHLKQLRRFRVLAEILKSLYTATLESLLTLSIASRFGNNSESYS